MNIAGGIFCGQRIRRYGQGGAQGVGMGHQRRHGARTEPLGRSMHNSRQRLDIPGFCVGHGNLLMGLLHS